MCGYIYTGSQKFVMDTAHMYTHMCIYMCIYIYVYAQLYENISIILYVDDCMYVYILLDHDGAS